MGRWADMYPDDDGAPDVKQLSSKFVKCARVNHVCNTCSGTILPGHSYSQVVWLVDGEFSISRQHDQECVLTAADNELDWAEAE
jgi:hypothetical protein